MTILCNLLRSLDIFGHKVGVKYRGEEAFKTRLGALLTVGTFVLIMINAQNLLVQFSDHSAQTEVINPIKVSRLIRIKKNKEEPVDLRQEGFDIAVTNFGIPIPRSIGWWSAHSVNVLTG